MCPLVRNAFWVPHYATWRALGSSSPKGREEPCLRNTLNMGNEDYSLKQYISENALKILKEYTINFFKYTFETQEVAFKKYTWLCRF